MTYTQQGEILNDLALRSSITSMNVQLPKRRMGGITSWLSVCLLA